MVKILRLNISTYFYVENKSYRYEELSYENIQGFLYILFVGPKSRHQDRERVKVVYCECSFRRQWKWLEFSRWISRWISRWSSRWISRCSGGETHSGVSWDFGQCHTEECRQVAEALESIKRGGKQSQRRHQRGESQVGALAERPRPTSTRRNNLAASRETSRETSRVFELMIKWAAGERGGSCSIRDPLQGTKPQNRTTTVPTRTVFTAGTGLYCTCDMLLSL